MKLTEKITADAVLEEIKCALKDCFIGRVAQEGDCISIRFLNGQVFELHITEKQ